MLAVSIEELKKAAIDFYNITHMKIVLYDADRKVLYSYPEMMSEFCAFVRTNTALAKKCLYCDHHAFDICERTRKAYIYNCHMHLTEAIAPIIENGVTIGYLMLGQVLNEAISSQVMKCIYQTAQRYEMNFDEMAAALKKLQSVTETYIHSAVSMMSMCASYLYFNRIIKKHTDVLSIQLKNYIQENLGEKLTVKKLCNVFYISKTKLYQISVHAFGRGISDYIRQCRLEQAKKQMEETEKTIEEIAYETGFKDANYFIRMFKKQMGVTPGKYRKCMMKLLL